MVGNIRMLAVGAGALGAAGVATFAGLSGLDRETEQAAPDSQSIEICLKADFRFFEGVEARCHQRAELARLRDAPLVDQRMENVVVVMTHPSDASATPAEVSTCRQFDDARFEGWYAMTTRDMRREAYFVRACGALNLLLGATQAETSHFVDGSPTGMEISSLGGDPILRFGADDLPAPGAPEIERLNATDWRISFDDQRVILQEIANADFDGDGVEEILAFLVAGPEEGTATIYAIALLEKDRVRGPVRLTPQPVVGDREGPSGAP